MYGISAKTAPGNFGKNSLKVCHHGLQYAVVKYHLILHTHENYMKNVYVCLFISFVYLVQ